jgi:hypothetical protein
MEMMHHESGVRTVAVGGLPRTGPMQAPAQSRGARLYSTGVMDIDMTFAGGLDNDTAALLPNRSVGRDLLINFASINLRDQVRKGDTVPLQFKYEAADCRIFFTMANYYNYSQLWLDAAAAIWTDSKRCVTNSTGFSFTGNTTAEKKPPSLTVLPDASSINLADIKPLPKEAGTLPADFAYQF